MLSSTPCHHRTQKRPGSRTSLLTAATTVGWWVPGENGAWCLGETRENSMAPFPICSMYGIFTYIYHRFRWNVGKYSIHGAYRFDMSGFKDHLFRRLKSWYFSTHFLGWFRGWRSMRRMGLEDLPMYNYMKWHKFMETKCKALDIQSYLLT